MEVKTWPKICCSCEKAINNVTKIAPTDDYDIDDIEGKTTERGCDTCTREASENFTIK